MGCIEPFWGDRRAEATTPGPSAWRRGAAESTGEVHLGKLRPSCLRGPPVEGAAARRRAPSRKGASFRHLRPQGPADGGLRGPRRPGNCPALFRPPEASRVRLLEASFLRLIIYAYCISCASCEAGLLQAWASALRSACHMSLSKKEARGAPLVSAEKKVQFPR